MLDTLSINLTVWDHEQTQQARKDFAWSFCSWSKFGLNTYHVVLIDDASVAKVFIYINYGVVQVYILLSISHEI